MQNIGRLFAMRSSTVTEMPTAKGVFGKGKQPYLPPQVDQKLQHYKKAHFNYLNNIISMIKDL